MGVNNRWRTNPFTGVVNSLLIEDEQHTIEYHAEVNAYGFYANEGVELDAGNPPALAEDTTAATAFTEIPKTTAPNAGQFRVDYDADGYYNTGFINCNSSDNGKAVLFTYYGTGTILHPTFRLQTDFNFPGNFVVEGALEVQSSTTFVADVTMDAGATVNPATTGGQALTVTGDATVQGDVVLASSSGATISASNKKVEDVADPTAATDAMNRQTADRRASFFYNWRTRKPVDTVNAYQAIAYGNGVFVAVVNNGATRVMRSTDGGETWTGASAAEANPWNDVAYGNGVFVAVASTGTNRVMRSTDNGATWSAVAAAAANQWTCVAYGNGVFVAASYDGTNRIMRSTDNGATWSSIAMTEASTWQSVTYGNGVFVAVADSGTNVVVRSTDYGVTWSTVSTTVRQWSTVVYALGRFIAGASDNTYISTLMYSDDNGATWTDVDEFFQVGTRHAMVEVDSTLYIFAPDMIAKTRDMVSFSTLLTTVFGTTYQTATDGTRIVATGNGVRVNDGGFYD